jgi:glycosyltransferase involved in cell wall biosynthesis
MSHSRNVAFSLATGDVVMNVDADNFIYPRNKTIEKSFCQYLNELANQAEGKKAIFAKGKRLLHGRLGFFRKEFIDLGGYDEEMSGYGYDDIDLIRRAWAVGCVLYWFGGIYLERFKTPNSMKGANMKNTNWRQTEKINKAIGYAKIEDGIFIANANITWGATHVTKNFKEEMYTGIKSCKKQEKPMPDV